MLSLQLIIRRLRFTEFDFDSAMLEGIDSMGFEEATPIQEQAIPIILDNHDLIACAQTGTGKTAAFLLPVINKVISESVNDTNTLIIVPTRELAIQIDQVLQGISYFTPVNSVAIYGGSDGSVFEIEKRALLEGVNIVIATPGRLISHLNMGNYRFDNVKHFILDEADRMLEMGFIDDIYRINKTLPEVKQTLMFSATMPPKIRGLAKKLLRNPKEINIAMSKPAEGVIQGAYLVEDNQKNPLIKSLLEKQSDITALIFASTKVKVKEVERDLKNLRMKVKAIHSDLEQQEREDVLRQFRSRNIQILVATNILSRGIDIEDIGLVINYNVPDDAENYVHRIGRTARAEATGIALTFINRRERGLFKQIEEQLGQEVHKIPLPAEISEIEPVQSPERKSSTRQRGRFNRR